MRVLIKRQQLYRTAITLLIAITAGCQSPPDKTTVERSLKKELNEQLAVEEEQRISKEALNDIPSDITSALLPSGVQKGQSAIEREEKYDINAKNVDARDFFAGLVHSTPYSVAIHPDVNGSISLSLKQVTLDEIMDLVTELYGYDIQKKGKVYRILSSGMRTETFSVNYLLMTREGVTQTSIVSGGVSQSSNSTSSTSNSLSDFTSADSSSSSGSSMSGNSNGTSISTRTQTNFWQDLEKNLSTMIGTEDGRAVFVTPQAGLVTVRALPAEIRAIKRFLKTSETQLQRQVILEARILEVVLSDGYQQGINWSEIIANVGSTELSFSSAANALSDSISLELGGVSSLTFLNQDFSGVLSLLSTQGNVQVLSSPRVTATNNQKAVIKVGDDEYFVTDVSSESTVTTTSTSTTPDIELTPFFSGIALDVTPQIDANGSVLLHVHPSVIETEEQTKELTIYEEEIELPLAQSSIRESDTVIRASSGEIVVIGGLMQTTLSDLESSVPVLGDIPILGNLFKNISQEEIKKELVILLKPTVVEPGTWSKQLEMSRSQMADWLYVD